MAFGLFNFGGKYFDKNMTPKCDYCHYGKRAKDGNKVLCEKRGLVDASFSCGKFSYSPLKRIPVKQLKFVGSLADDEIYVETKDDKAEKEAALNAGNVKNEPTASVTASSFVKPQESAPIGNVPPMPQNNMAGNVRPMSQENAPVVNMPMAPQDNMAGNVRPMPQENAPVVNTPMAPQDNMAGNVRPMPQGSVQIGNVPPMPQENMAGNVRPMPQGSVQIGNVPPMPQENAPVNSVHLNNLNN